MFQRFSMLARGLEIPLSMTRGMLITGTLALAITVSSIGLDAQDSQPVAAFKSSVDMVRVTAVVRDRKGRFVQDLKPRDFEVVDNGRSRAISDLQSDTAGISVAEVVAGRCLQRLGDRLLVAPS